jgi:hypothetical protein
MSEFHQERTFESVFDEAHTRMLQGRGAYLVTMAETAGMTQNCFDYDPATHRYRHFKLSLDPTKPLDMETGSKEVTRFYTEQEINEFRLAMLIATRNGLQSQNVQYYQPGTDKMIDDTGFPLANITYISNMAPLPFAQPTPLTPASPPKPAKLSPSFNWSYLWLLLFVVLVAALAYAVWKK